MDNLKTPMDLDTAKQIMQEMSQDHGVPVVELLNIYQHTQINGAAPHFLPEENRAAQILMEGS